MPLSTPRDQENPPRLQRRLGTALLACGAVVVVIAAFLVGTGDLGNDELSAAFLELRGARAAAAFLAGGALSIAGLVVQGIFRNPLASPSILGTTGGAALGGHASVLWVDAWFRNAAVLPIQPDLIYTFACLFGAAVSLLILLAFVRRGVGAVSLLLTGFVLASLFASLASFLTVLSQEEYELGRAIVSYSLGGVGGVGVERVLLALPLVVAAGVGAWLWGRHLDVLLSGEAEATSLGVDVRQVRRWAVVWAAVATGAAVSVGGNVSFVGLLVPHALRPFFGVEHRGLVVVSFLLGGTFLVACDILLRIAPTDGEAPLGVVTGLIGAPLFLFLLLRRAREMFHG